MSLWIDLSLLTLTRSLFSHIFSYMPHILHSCHSLYLKHSFPILSPDPLLFMFQALFKSCLQCVVYHDLAKLGAPLPMLPGFLTPLTLD